MVAFFIFLEKKYVLKKLVLVILSFSLISCQKNYEPSLNDFDPESYWGENPWPDIRKKRINTLLPKALKSTNIDCWMVVCRENNNDPLADHIGGENAGGTAVFLFYNDSEGFHSKVFSPVGESTALSDLKIHEEVIPVERGKSPINLAVDFIKKKDFVRVAVNTSETNSIADGLSFSQRTQIENVMGEYSDRIVSATELVYEWLSIKLPEEVEILTHAAQLTADWQLEAYTKVIPGKTTDADIANFLKDKMAEYNVTDAWSPDQNPNVNSGPDRGHSHATNKVIVAGDVIQIDFGIKLYGRWVSDIQRFAYVLKEGETEAPEDIQQYWESSKAGNRVVLKTMKPGVKGVEVDLAQRELMKKAGSEFVMWSTGHPVGYVAHDVGPNLGGSQSSHVRPSSQKQLKEGMTFAFDGFHAWTMANGKTKTISVEEMAVVTKNGARYLIEPQEQLILISSD